ncbi:MAG: hypothetical protein IKF00_05620 [Solobacterium sp.]|nr:hypothetical protein [Solobacterium sp.]
MSAEELKTDKPAEKPKKEKKPAEKTEKKPAEAKTAKRYKYPFQVYFAGRVHDLTGFFEDGKEYTEKQISDVMLAQHFYEFSGQVSYDYMEDTNTLVAMFHQHKKG